MWCFSTCKDGDQFVAQLRMAHSTRSIRILAYPQTSYRERYNSELDPKRHRAQRFIRAETHPNSHEYPTVEISKQWNSNKKLYIRVTLVTVPTDKVPIMCIHPYPIDTTENVIKDPERNTLFFQITIDDFTVGFKSLRITRKKLIQYELKNYGQLRILNSDQRDIQRIDDPNDARKIIDVYQLGKSQLVFSLAELFHENELPAIFETTTAYSNIMTAISTTSTVYADDLSVRCVPKKGRWEGGDEILMVIPKVDRRRSCKLFLEHSSTEQIDEISMEFVDSKTISFTTPPCPFPTNSDQRIQIPFVVIQGNEEIARVHFHYQSMNKDLPSNTEDIFDESNICSQSTTMDTCFDDPLFYDDTDFHSHLN